MAEFHPRKKSRYTGGSFHIGANVLQRPTLRGPEQQAASPARSTPKNRCIRLAMFSKDLLRNFLVMPEEQWRDVLWDVRSNGLIALAAMVSIVMLAKLAITGETDAHFILALKDTVMVSTIVIGAALVSAEIIGLRRERLKNDRAGTH